MHVLGVDMIASPSSGLGCGWMAGMGCRDVVVRESEAGLRMVITRRWAGCYGVPPLHSDSRESLLSCTEEERAVELSGALRITFTQMHHRQSYNTCEDLVQATIYFLFLYFSVVL